MQLIADLLGGEKSRFADRVIKFVTPMTLVPNVLRQGKRLEDRAHVFYAGDDWADLPYNVLYKATNIPFGVHERLSSVDGKPVVSVPGMIGGEVFFKGYVAPKLDWRANNPTHRWLSKNNLYQAIPDRRFLGSDIEVEVENEEGDTYLEKQQMKPEQFNKMVSQVSGNAFKRLEKMVQSGVFEYQGAIKKANFKKLKDLDMKYTPIKGTNQYLISGTPEQFKNLALSGFYDTQSNEVSKILKGETNAPWWALNKVIGNLYKKEQEAYLNREKDKAEKAKVKVKN